MRKEVGVGRRIVEQLGDRLGLLRMVNAEIKRVEVDERIDVDDTRALQILDRMLRQRAESERQYREAGRDDLADTEAYEIGVIREFMPEALDGDELQALIRAAIESTGASSMRDMGAVMAALRPQVQGRADMGSVSAAVKQLLQG